MKSSLWRTFLGLFMIVLGIALFVQYSGFFPGFNEYWGYIFAGLLALGGLAFLYTLIEDHSRWWAVIPGVTLLGLAGLIFLVSWSPQQGVLASALFMASIGLSFLLVYIMKREFWWALIPALVMFGLSVMLTLEAAASLWHLNIPDQLPVAVFLAFIGLGFAAIYLVRKESWWPVIPAGSMISVAVLVATGNVGSLFLGLGITFGLLSLLPGDDGRMSWPLIPGATLFLLGLIFNIGRGMWGNYIFPSLLILAGLYLVGRAVLNNNMKRGSHE